LKDFRIKANLLIYTVFNIVWLILLKLVFLLKTLKVFYTEDSEKYFFNYFGVLHQFFFQISHYCNEIIIVWTILFIGFNSYLLLIILLKVLSKKQILISIFFSIVILIISEVWLISKDYKPGVHTKVYFFNQVDSLYLLKGPYTDSMGILKIDSLVKNEICNNVKLKINDWNSEVHSDVYSIAKEQIMFINGLVENELYETYNQILKKEVCDLTILDSAIIDYIHCPINIDGFRSIAFKNYNTSKPKVLLLGDSFTWGHSTTIKTNSFADILLSRGYVVYNTGISATDVAQYLAVAKKYIPLLKPDFVIANFYLGNDVTYFKREVLPDRPMLYTTNAGNLMACPHGKYFVSAKDAYDFTLKHMIIDEKDNFLFCLASKTVISTLILQALYELKIINNFCFDIVKYYHEAEKRKFNKPYCNLELKHIENICSREGSIFILSSIPELSEKSIKTVKNFPNLFEGIMYHEMPVNKSYYKLSDGHFNDLGHRKYADYLDSLILTYKLQ
jgi:hypothetical protein